MNPLPALVPNKPTTYADATTIAAAAMPVNALVRNFMISSFVKFSRLRTPVATLDFELQTPDYRLRTNL